MKNELYNALQYTFFLMGSHKYKEKLPCVCTDKVYGAYLFQDEETTRIETNFKFPAALFILINTYEFSSSIPILVIDANLLFNTIYTYFKIHFSLL